VHFDKKGLLASGSVDNSVKMWDIASGKCLDTLKDHIGNVYSVHFDGKELQQGVKLSEFGNSKKSNKKLDTLSGYWLW